MRIQHAFIPVQLLRKLPRADAVVLTVNNNELYTRWVLVAVKAWKKLGIKPYVFFIAEEDEEVPAHLDIPELQRILTVGKTSSFAQVSRLLLPALIDAKNVLISDIDYIPLPSWYWDLSSGHDSDAFVVMRLKSGENGNGEAFMGFNCAAPDVWGRMFGLESRTIEGVREKVREWYPLEWSSDQKILNNKIRNTNEKVVVAYDGSDPEQRHIYMLTENYEKYELGKAGQAKTLVGLEDINEDFIWFGNDENRSKNVIEDAYALLEILDYKYN